MTTVRSDRQAADEDPRKLRSRTRLLDAATTLLAEGGVDAVTIDAVTKLANVARATLYRHFDSGTELVAAAFARLLPSVPALSGEGDLRAQLLELLTNQAKAIESAPVQVTAMCWLGLGPDLTGYSSAAALTERQPEMRSLRQMIIEQYRDAFDRVLRTPEAIEELGEYDYDVALAQLVGPLVLTKLATLTPLGESACAQIVDDFLAARRA
ncbi:TetR/AcrR family transcriptional regulator [Rhodococcus sp. ACPA4]|uniref:Helix-turn-helix domain-containing protein n=1 Tax=Rhodococcus globerulus TaxID=33008 RepID=A0ABU4C1B1_RHOGO|nr:MULTISPECIES: TetR/AcrR family transcriptional regulator [Rhodococcus]NMD60402.1 TetR/AcrR family transcriptional regulator [Nocardia globerula]MDV6270276.1 helix-turn-helix domain-containing protein [Rhodococcus globerulus]MDV8069476.1 helix-turn-helix domain-containing protein [Rhodococcus sp. IEGM 1366]PBC44547.1 TetR/AcrR family transcriptional regulator [Rhodococcus sp. ACPA4]PVX63483.1 TetR family transcriptional regulator [Rhodococcus globerulus]